MIKAHLFNLAVSSIVILIGNFSGLEGWPFWFGLIAYWGGMLAGANYAREDYE